MAEISEVMLFCEKYYSKKKFLHALRVAAFALDKAEHDDRVDSKDAFIVGLCHDLIEDTDCPQDKLQEILGTDLFSAVVILTKDDKDDYNKYIYSILDSGDKLAILVKKADMKDHFMKSEDLIERLRDKLLSEVGIFL